MDAECRAAGGRASLLDNIYTFALRIYVHLAVHSLPCDLDTLILGIRGTLPLLDLIMFQDLFYLQLTWLRVPPQFDPYPAIGRRGFRRPSRLFPLANGE